LTLASYESLLNGFKFNSASNFPGPCNPPANSNQTHTATLSASYLNTRGWTTQGDGSGSFARKPTGCYLAPGSIATVTVPAALVGKGYKIRVGAHSWDFSNKPTIKRLDRSTLLYPINSVDTKIACPHGGGIYLEVPWLANQGVVSVQVRNAVRAPYFSAKSFHQTTPTEWLSERTNAAPWADFQSDKFMTQVPRSWIYAMPDPTQLMKDWDAAMDACNDLMGFPRLRGKESFYLQPDVLIRASVYAPGYPAVNVGGYSATANYNNGYHTHYLVRGPQYGTDDAQVEFHEQGHGYFFDKFPGETEANVNLLFVPVLQRKFGISLDTAFRASLGDGITYRTLETTAMAWMTVFNFSPREVEMADGEKAYQLKGHAKFVDLARIYGWGVLSNYWTSFVNDYENGISYATDTDSLLLRLSRSVGADIRPLFHFWGIYPANPATLNTAITNANLVAPVEIYDTLVRYKSLVPPNNSAFTNFAYKWWNKKPSINGYWEEREHARQWDTNALYSAGDQQRSEATNPGEIYNENSAFDITNRVQELLNLYYPNGRPLTVTPPAILGLSPADGTTNVALDENLVVTFNKSIVRGTGNITLKNLTDGTQTTIAVTNTTQVSLVGEVLTINPPANFSPGKLYAVQIAPTAIGGLATNVFAGITNDTAWNFTTTNPDVIAPVILSLSPADGATNVTVSANLVATFSEPIQLGTGNLTLRNLTDATQTTIAVTNVAQVSVAGAVLTINPATNLLAGKAYALQIAATAIDDLVTNSFAGIANDTIWNFTTQTDFAVWAAQFAGANLADPNADFDGDGLSNNYERIWGLNPTNAASRNSFTAIAGIKSGNFSYTRRTRALTGLNYTVWTSTNLVTWAQDPGAIQTPGTLVAEVETVAVTLSPALLTGPQLFVRMRAE
ncbi:MAG: Ig-like domain-containing protein, partial [Verrucomicrobia bacterium]|nr:Ig-like domain-containing protein [Verrucomicrobiota bacterium]